MLEVERLQMNDQILTAKIVFLKNDVERLNARIEVLDAALRRIVQWSEAYPPDIFPEPDWKKAAALLNAGGITLDRISGSCMRHVVEGVGEIARAALTPEQEK
jgi:hypothetical protein